MSDQGMRVLAALHKIGGKDPKAKDLNRYLSAKGR
jgi:hypothetical protein